MKKFLTMLLALSVVFTFTFGSTMSVFAYTNTTNEFNANVNQAEAQVISELDTVYANVIKSLADDTLVNSVSMDKAALEVAAKEYYDVVVDAIKAKSNAIKCEEEYVAATGTAVAGVTYYSYDGSAYTVASPQPAVGDDVTSYYVKGLKNTDASIATLVGMYAGTTETFTSFMSNYVNYTKNEDGIDKAARAQFAVDKAASIKIVNSIDLTKFSANEQKITVNSETKTTSYKALATKEVEEIVKDIEDVTITDSATAANVVTALGTIGYIAETKTSIAAAGTGIMAAVENIYDKAEENVVGYQFVKSYRENSGSNNVKAVIKTADEEALAGTQLEAEKTAAIANVTTKAAVFQSAIASLTEAADRATATDVKDAFVEAWTFNINACDTATDLQTLVGYSAGAYTYSNIVAPTTSNYTSASYAENKKTLAAIKLYAEKYAAEYDVYGNLVRDEAKIKKVLKAAEEAMYAANNTLWNGKVTAIPSLHATETDPYTLILSHCGVDNSVDAYTLNNKIAQLEADYQAYVDNATYYALELEKVKAVYDAKIAEYKAVTTTSEFAKVKNVDLTGIKTAATVRGDINALSNYTVQVGKLTGYQGVLNSTLGSTDDGYRNFTNVTVDVASTTYNMTQNAYWTNFYAENNARTATEIEALYSKAVAAMEAVPTVKELKTQKASVEALISALPTTVTLADKPAIKAAWEAMEAYASAKGTNNIANAGTLLLDIKSVEALEEKAVKAAFDELKLTLANVAVADKEKVAAVVTLYDSYTADWSAVVGAEGMYYGNAVGQYSEALLNDAYNNTTGAPDTTSLLGKIRSLEVTEVEKAVSAIPVNVELKDKATVEAARAAYDAYVTTYSYTHDANKTPNAHDASNDFAGTVLTTLEAAEDAIAVAQAKQDALDKIEAEKAEAIKNLETKLAVKDTTARFASSKAYKNSIKLTFKKPAVGVDGYKVYMATKKNGAYKLVGTTKTNTFTKKSLKKGTTYYFKVKAYKVVGEQTVYTQTSGKLAKKTTK